MRILVIDDEPHRTKYLLQGKHDVQLAHGKDQINWWLTNDVWAPQLICLDHDMPRMNGTQVVEEFWEPLLTVPIWIWSWNQNAATRLYQFLQQRSKENDLPFCVHQEMWTSEYPRIIHKLITQYQAIK